MIAPRMALLMVLALIGACSADQDIHSTAPNDDTADAAVLSPQDRAFIEKAAQGNNAEIADGGLVIGRSANGSVIAFGRMMVADHGAANARLAEIARKHEIALPTSPGDHQAGYDRLVDKKGVEFDEEFVRVMIEDHNTARQLYQDELASGADPMLLQYAASMLPKIEAHLAEAKALTISVE